MLEYCTEISKQTIFFVLYFCDIGSQPKTNQKFLIHGIFANFVQGLKYDAIFFFRCIESGKKSSIQNHEGKEIDKTGGRSKSSVIFLT